MSADTWKNTHKMFIELSPELLGSDYSKIHLKTNRSEISDDYHRGSLATPTWGNLGISFVIFELMSIEFQTLHLPR